MTFRRMKDLLRLQLDNVNVEWVLDSLDLSDGGVYKELLEP